jgi:hypothetical protein
MFTLVTGFVFANRLTQIAFLRAEDVFGACANRRSGKGIKKIFWVSVSVQKDFLPHALLIFCEYPKGFNSFRICLHVYTESLQLLYKLTFRLWVFSGFSLCLCAPS